ncbi:MAG: ATP synthase subunit I [Burkholderiales bacterium]|nr:ATP synthase subunit I [Burkholderiales bacterium]
MRAALGWQLVVTGIVATIAAFLGGPHAAVSAALGGAVVVVANLGYASIVCLSAPRTAGATVRTLLRAEAVKIALIVLALWLVFTSYRDVVPLALIGTLVATVLVWPVALLYKD